MRIDLLLLIVALLPWPSNSVPCYSEMLQTSSFGSDSSPPKQSFDFRSDTQFKALTSLSMSSWVHPSSQFQLSLEADSQMVLTLIVQTLSTAVSSSLSYTLNDPSASFTKTSEWSYLFITLDFASKICLYQIQVLSNFSSSQPVPLCIVMKASPINLSSYLIVKFTLNGVAITRGIFLHRDYGMTKITNDNPQTVFSMMLREDTKLLSSFNFAYLNLDPRFIVDSETICPFSVNMDTKYLPPTTHSPTLFDKGLLFEQKEVFQFSQFYSTPITKEFTVSFSLETSVQTINPSYPLFSIISSGIDFINIQLVNKDIFKDYINLTINSQSTPLMNCEVTRITEQNQLIIIGYSYQLIDITKYYVEIILNGQRCMSSPAVMNLALLTTNAFSLQFGDQDSIYSKYFIIRSLRVYQGSYSPITSGACNSKCNVSQRRQHTELEDLKQYYTDLGQSYTSPSQALIIMPVQKSMSLSCMSCSDYKYFIDEYCVEGASMCPKFIDIKSNTCIQTLACSDPLRNSLDCLNTCQDQFAIDPTTAECSVKCHYSCKQCDSSTMKCIDSTSCPLTRVFDSATSLCICKSDTTTTKYFDDGLSLECITQTIILPFPGLPLPPGLPSSLENIFDIKVLPGDIKISKLSFYQIYGSTRSVTYSNSQPMTDLEKGLLFYQEQAMEITTAFTKFYSIRYWLFINGPLGREVSMISLKSASGNILEIGLNQFDQRRYSIKVCFFNRCSSIQSNSLAVIDQTWTQVSISLLDSELFFTPTIYLNGNQRASVQFEKMSSIELFYPYPLTGNPILYTFIIGKADNTFHEKDTSYFAVRFITFFDQQIFSISDYSYTSSQCAIYVGTNCILCMKGYRFSSTSALQCEPETDSISNPKFYYQVFRTVTDCQVNPTICSQCDITPITCSTCVTPSSDRKSTLPCDCIDGKYPDPNQICQQCNSICQTCNILNVCTSCGPNREIIPTCNCKDGFYTIYPSTTCVSCDSSCISCDSIQKCTCPNLSLTFRIKNGDQSCPCQQGFFDSGKPSKICSKCFLNCQTCISGEENSCISCKVSSSELRVIAPRSIGSCICNDPSLYLNNVGICKSYVTAEFSIVISPFRNEVNLIINLSEPIELSSISQWTSLITYTLITSDQQSHNRVLQSTSNLELIASNDRLNQNVGIVKISVKQSCRVEKLRLVINSSSSIRSADGVPLALSYTNKMLELDVGPFLFNLEDSEINDSVVLLDSIKVLQSSILISTLRVLSVPLFFANFLQPLTQILFIQLILPLPSHLILSKLASMIFPHTLDWMEVRMMPGLAQPSYFFGIPISPSNEVYLSSTFQQMGIPSNFFLVIAESAVLLLLVVIFVLITKFLSKRKEPRSDKQTELIKLQNQGISFGINLTEVRLLYILLSVFLPMRQQQYSPFLAASSTLFAFIAFFGLLFGLHQLRKMLNSYNNKNELESYRIQHLVDFLEVNKPIPIVLNYKLLQAFKKFANCFIIVMFVEAPSTAIIMLITLSIFSFLLDIIARPYKVKLTNIVRILSSISWIVLLVITLVIYSHQQEMKMQDYLLDVSLVQKFNQLGTVFNTFVYIYSSLNIAILCLKAAQVLNNFYGYLTSERKNDIVYLCNQVNDDGEYERVQHASLDFYSPDDNPIRNKVNSDYSANDQILQPQEKYLFNFKQANIAKIFHRKKL